jgi:two-component system NarL family response regulator
VRILVADDNALTRLGIVTMLGTEHGFEVVGEAPDGAKAVSLWNALRPDVAVVDLKMPAFDGVQVVAQICRTHPDAKLLVLTHYDSDESLFQALRAGAKGYLTKECGGEELVAAVRTLAQGGRHLGPEHASRIAGRMTQPSLTAREHEVLGHMAVGLTNKQIGEKLSMSERTVGTHVRQILAKLGAHNRTEAVALGRQRGLIEGR